VGSRLLLPLRRGLEEREGPPGGPGGPGGGWKEATGSEGGGAGAPKVEKEGGSWDTGGGWKEGWKEGCGGWKEG